MHQYCFTSRATQVPRALQSHTAPEQVSQIQSPTYGRGHHSWQETSLFACTLLLQDFLVGGLFVLVST